jgi:hypothetical protein
VAAPHNTATRIHDAGRAGARSVGCIRRAFRGALWADAKACVRDAPPTLSQRSAVSGSTTYAAVLGYRLTLAVLALAVGLA